MNFPVLSWLFALAITLHNLEEALWLPGWSQSARRWHHPVGAREFRFAVGVLTALAYVAAYLSVAGGKESVGAYFIAGYALTMLMNVFFPHLLATLIMRRYAPGTATALLLNLPVTVLLLYQGLQQGYIRFSTFMWAGPLVVAAILSAIPLLFAIGRCPWSVRES
ncbi:MAG: HXXEE domain-containing protein [Desulfobacterales bacterium]|nr:HXXEE domain-containing protein [Pseudomonadota bacterium]MCG2776061.1 HXXEE domain-containing protein [Desulfobacterales bacterium]